MKQVTHPEHKPRETSKIVDEWVVGAVLPNIEVREPIEGSLVALVPADDPRVLALGAAHPNLPSFLSRFTDPFGEQISPGVIVVRANTPASVLSVETLSGFRDAVSVALIPLNRARDATRRGGSLRPRYSNAFSFYPWTLDKDYENLVGRTPAFFGLHDVHAFHGQSSPEIPRQTLAPSDTDEPLLTALLERWQHRYTKRSPAWPDLALFRSLNMANQASLIPAGTDTTLYDVGRSIALWVSAFEILVHPGGKEKAGLQQVYELLEKTHWEIPRTGHRLYHAHKTPKGQRRNLACWLYGKLYSARNDFLHGNPISQERLKLKDAGLSLFHIAAPLYRLALTAFLDLSWIAPIPRESGALGRYMAEKWRFTGYQEVHEKALHATRGSQREVTTSGSPRGQRDRRPP